MKIVLSSVVAMEAYPANSPTATAGQKSCAVEVQAIVNNQDFWKKVKDCTLLWECFAEVSHQFGLLHFKAFTPILEDICFVF